MSENLDLVRSIYADWERGDFGSFEWAHPDIELVAIGGPNPGSTVGTTAMREAWRDFLREWRDYRTTVQEYRELDDGRILALVRVSRRGKRSVIDYGRTVTQAGNLFEVNDGKVTKLLLYWDSDRALADLGLQEGALPEEATTYDPEELARRFLAAVNRRDVQAVESFYAPNAVLRGAEIGLLAGPGAIGGFFEDLLSRYDEFLGEVEEIADLGNGVGFLVTIFTARPVGSDEMVETRLASVLVGSKSLIERQTNYTDVDEARAAAERLAGSREQAGSQESTTSDAVELTRRYIEAYNAGDLESAIGFYSADAVWEARQGLGVFEGRAALGGFLEDWTAAYEHWELVAPEIYNLGNGVVLYEALQKARIAGTRRDVQLRFAAVMVWMERRIERINTYADIDEARAAGERLARSRE